MKNAFGVIFALAIAILAAPVQAAQIKGEGDGEVGFITIDGTIEEGDKRRLGEVLVRYRKGFIVLNGPGGNLVEALAMGEKIAEGDYITIIPADGTCVSSCSLIWLAGKNRMIEPGGRVGFHSAYTKQEGKNIATGFGNAMIGRYLATLSLSLKATYFITSAPPDEMYWLDTKDPGVEGISYAFVSFDEVMEKVTGVKPQARQVVPPSPSKAINPQQNKAVKVKP